MIGVLSDREYSRRVRLVVGIVLGVVAAIAVAVGGFSWYWHRIAADAAYRQYVRWSMVEEFEGRDWNHPPLGDAPRGFSYGDSFDPDAWPVGPISSERVAGLRKAISVYNFLFPGDTVSFESVKRAYGKDLKRNVEQGWKLDKKEHAFVYWSRRYANLVYKEDVFSGGRLLHRKGDKVKAHISNYDYVANSEGDYSSYMFSGQGE